MDWEPHDRHWIRLRGPWRVSWIAADGTARSAQRVTLPSDWKSFAAEHCGTGRFERTFQKPTQLDADERVCITLTNVGADVQCQINGVPVPRLPTPLGDATCWPADECCSFDVTEHLQSTNRLTLEMRVPEATPLPVGLHEPVLIEIVTPDDDAS